MTPENFYYIALPFIIVGSIAGIINTCLQYYDILLDKCYNNPEEKPLTLLQLIVILCCRSKFKGNKNGNPRSRDEIPESRK